MADRFPALPVLRGGVRAHHAEALHPVGDRDPPPAPAVSPLRGGFADDGHVLVRAARQRAVDRHFRSALARVRSPAGQLPQHLLLEVHREQRHVVQAHGLGVRGHDARQLLQRRGVAGLHQVGEHLSHPDRVGHGVRLLPVTETPRAVRRPSGRHRPVPPLTAEIVPFTHHPGCHPVLLERHAPGSAGTGAAQHVRALLRASPSPARTTPGRRSGAGACTDGRCVVGMRDRGGGAAVPERRAAAGRRHPVRRARRPAARPGVRQPHRGLASSPPRPRHAHDFAGRPDGPTHRRTLLVDARIAHGTPRPRAGSGRTGPRRAVCAGNFRFGGVREESQLRSEWRRSELNLS